MSPRFEPAGDCAPGHALDSSHSRYRKPVNTHVDDFIKQRPGFVPPTIGCSVGGREGSVALIATVAPPAALCGDVEGMADDVAFAELSIQAAIGVGTGASGLLAPLHTCLLPENEQGIQLESCVAGLMETINNSSVMKQRAILGDTL